MVVGGGCVPMKREAGVGGWAKTSNRAAVARLRARRVKWRRGMVRMGGTVVSTSDGGGGGVCALAKREAGGGLGQKPATEPPWLGCGLEWSCKRWRGVLWGYKPPSRANLGCGMGGEVAMVLGVGGVLTWHPFCFSTSSHQLHSPLYPFLTSVATVNDRRFWKFGIA
jgi:hypothetical protein